MVEKFVAYVYFEGGFLFNIKESNCYDTHDEAVSFIKECEDNEDFLYGTIQKRFAKGEAQQTE